jgi:nucleotide-binding universal stress UspA family protein
MEDMSGIVVGIDGSGHSGRALEWAVREAAVRQAPLRVITVHPPVASYLGRNIDQPQDDAVSEKARTAARAQVEQILDRLGETRPPRIALDAISGSPAEELLRSAVDADLLVVGSRGSGGFARLVMGSVSSQVAHHAQCPVVIVPAAPQ